MSQQASAATEFFVDTWEVYRKLVAANDMFHRELYAEVEKRLTPADGQPFSLLDLGCGDAARLAPVLRRLPVSCYLGVDLSPVALELAAANLRKLSGAVAFQLGNILDTLAGEKEPVDVIFSSFVLHHLDADEQLAFLQGCRRHLRPGGTLLLIDVLRDEGQSLPDYLDAYIGVMERDWTTLTPEECRYATTHVRHFDRPGTLGELRARSEVAGFREFQPVCRHSWHHLVGMRAV
jgi:SAM-dependent methyltransferase